MTEEKKTITLPHHVMLEDRHSLTVSAVTDVDSFDEQTVIAITEMGDLTIRGSDLHINRLSVDSGELSVEGNIVSLTYSDEPQRGGGFFSRVFR